jgi:taurine dioxygenase
VAGRICCTQEGKLMSTAVTAIDVHRVAGSIGAEISGVRVGPDLPGPVVKQIRDALLEHKVIFFRGQDHLDDAAQTGFAQLFGEPRLLGRKKLDTPKRYVNEVDSSYSRATVWHTDKTTTIRPTSMTLLRALVLPPFGGDTCWANTATAYQRMGPDWQQVADGLRVVHSNNMIGGVKLRAEAAARAAGAATEGFLLDTDPADARQDAGDAGLIERKVFETEHPVVRVHPETGERSLLLGAWAKTIVGRDDSDSLLNIFQAFVTSLDNTVRWQWAMGDLVMWDNRATQHCAVGDYGSRKRVMHRITLNGDVPVGVDGRPSIVLKSPAKAAKAAEAAEAEAGEE